MKTEIETARSSRAQLLPAPSLRVPVTAGNRELLRWLRAAELSAWEAGATRICIGSHRFPVRTGADRFTPTFNPSYSMP